MIDVKKGLHARSSKDAGRNNGTEVAHTVAQFITAAIQVVIPKSVQLPECFSFHAWRGEMGVGMAERRMVMGGHMQNIPWEFASS